MRKRSGRLGSLVAQLDTQASLPRHIFASSAETRQAWHLQIYLCRRAGIPCSLYLCAQIDCTWILPTNKGSLMVVGEGEKGPRLFPAKGGTGDNLILECGFSVHRDRPGPCVTNLKEI